METKIERIKKMIENWEELKSRAELEIKELKTWLGNERLLYAPQSGDEVTDQSLSDNK